MRPERSRSYYFNALGRKITDISVNLAGIGRVEELLTWVRRKIFRARRILKSGGEVFSFGKYPLDMESRERERR